MFFKFKQSFEEVVPGNPDTIISVVSIAVVQEPKDDEDVADYIDIARLENLVSNTIMHKLTLVQKKTEDPNDHWAFLSDDSWNAFCSLVARTGNRMTHSLELPQTAFLKREGKRNIFLEDRMLSLIGQLPAANVRTLLLTKIKQDCWAVLPGIAQHLCHLTKLGIEGPGVEDPGIMAQYLWRRTSLPAAFADHLSSAINELKQLQTFKINKLEVEDGDKSWAKIVRAICPKPGFFNANFEDVGYMTYSGRYMVNVAGDVNRMMFHQENKEDIEGLVDVLIHYPLLSDWILGSPRGRDLLVQLLRKILDGRVEQNH